MEQILKKGQSDGEQRAMDARLLLRDESPLKRARACKTLGRLKDRMSVLALIRALEAPEEAVWQASAEALGKIGDVDAIAALIKWGQ